MPSRRMAIGDRFGRLVVAGSPVSAPANAKDGCRRVSCRCDCGVTTVVRVDYLRSGHTQSCGCKSAEARQKTLQRRKAVAVTHTPEHRAWINMRYRCRTPTCPCYSDYGGRGIRVCSEWDSFAAFLAAVGRRPSPRHSLHRIDNDGHYEPSNVEWAIHQKQCCFTQRAHRLTYGGVTMTLAEWARHLGMSQATLQRRIVQLKWPIRKAFQTPTTLYHHRHNASKANSSATMSRLNRAVGTPAET